MKPVFVVSEWLAMEGKDQELWDRFQELIAITRQEKGCVRAHVTRQLSHPGSPGKSNYQIFLLQEYKDIESFDEHCKASYVVDFFKAHVESPDRIVKDWTCRLFGENT